MSNHKAIICYTSACWYCDGEKGPRGNENTSNFCDSPSNVGIPSMSHEYILTDVDNHENLQVQHSTLKNLEEAKILYNMNDNQKWTNRELSHRHFRRY